MSVQVEMVKMDPQLMNLLGKVVPSQFHHIVENIYETSKELEEERSTKSEQKPRKFTRTGCRAMTALSGNEEVENKVEYLTIARVVMQVWSTRMFKYAEDVILTKAIEENYIEKRHLKFITVFEEDLQETDKCEWVIQDQDEVVIELLWEKFNLKAHFEEVHIHRMFIQRSYNRLKGFLPELHPEIIERHDLSKYAFNQALGYTLKFQHKVWHPIWKTACELHLNNEPHHPQAWSKNIGVQEKRLMLKNWIEVSSFCNNDCPYGLDFSTISFDSAALPLPFLLESYVDMVAIEWERKKGKDLSISNSELIYMEEKYLMRYTIRQRKQVSDLVNLVISLDKSIHSVNFKDRELILLKTIPEKEREQFLFRFEYHRKKELKRQKEKVSGLESLDTVPVSEEIWKKASDHAFNYNVGVVIMDMWNSKYRKLIEHLTLKRAIKEGFISEGHLKWIFFAEEIESHIENPFISSDMEDHEDIVALIWEEFDMRQHFSQLKEHRYWLRRSYRRLSKFVPELPEEVIERHDLSKLAFSQAVGYTLKWVHDINSSVWKKACEIHLNREPHHPQMWQKRHSPSYKQKCLESYLCHLADGEYKYGIDINLLDLASENMALVFLLESFLDMVAVEWERNKNKREDLSDSELILMDEKFLNRYYLRDKKIVLSVIDKICEADKPLPYCNHTVN